MSAMRRERVEISVDDERGVFMISVAAELAHMHPQTLRMYEARGLIEPQRSPKNTRLYSQQDVEQLRHIQRLTSSGLNLAGVEIVLDMDGKMTKQHGVKTFPSAVIEIEGKKSIITKAAELEAKFK